MITLKKLLDWILLAYSLFNKEADHSQKINRQEKIMQKENTKLSFEEFSEKAKGKKYIIIDVRTAEEISRGKLFKDALEIDFYNEDFENQISKLNKEDKYLLYCRSGIRSGKTMNIMKDLSFEKVYDLDKGYNGVNGL